MRTINILLIVQLLTLICATQSAKILVVFTLPGRSHYNLGSSLAKGLAEKGHDVTIISCFKEKVPPKNGTYREIQITGLFEEMQDAMKNMNMFDREESHPMLTIFFILSMMNEFSDKILGHENVQNLIKSNEEFDVVIIEQFLNDAQKAFASHFKAPLILLSPVGPCYWINPLVGNPSPPSYISDVLLSYSSNMTFTQRFENSLMYLWNSLIHHVLYFPQQTKLIRKHFPNPPELDDVLYNASLVLLNSHPSLNQPVPQVPNMINIGGFHVQPPKKLPKDLREFLDNAPEGVIYFSLGSNLKSAQLPIDKREALLKTFAKLKQKVLWKWEEDELPGQPKNVKLGKWFPQQDILAHPNVKLFITHGGLLSTTETIYHGVPILAIPIFGDQKMNAKRAVNDGYGLTVFYGEIGEEKLTKTINELLNNPKYRENAKMRSKVFHDREVSPMETAVYWIEYVIRHKGAPHLRVAGLDLPWYQYHLVDVIALIIGLAVIGIIISYLIGMFLYRRLFGKNEYKKIKKH